MYILGS